MPKRLSSQLTSKEIRKEIYRMRRELRGSIKEVRELSRTSPTIPTYAVDTMKELEKTMRKTAVSKMTKKQLVSTYRQLEYISGLKSSTVTGAKVIAQKFEPFKESLLELSDKQIKDFWKIYNLVYSSSRATAERFKYEIFTTDVKDLIINKLNDNYTSTEIATAIEGAIAEANLKYSEEMEEAFWLAQENKPLKPRHKDANRNVVLFSKELKKVLR